MGSVVTNPAGKDFRGGGIGGSSGKGFGVADGLTIWLIRGETKPAGDGMPLICGM